MKKHLALAACLLPALGGLVSCSPVRHEVAAPAAPFDQRFWVEDYVTGLTFPWEMTWLPNGDLLLTQRKGKLTLIRDGKVIGDIAGVPEVMSASPYDGLLDVKLDPDFATNHNVFLTYTVGDMTARVGVVYRARLDGTRLVEGRELFRTSPPAPTGGPNIMRMLFLPDKSLLVAVGCSGQPGSGMVQSLASDLGKIIRINRDGSMPADNALAATAPGARPEFFAGGFRSPSGLALDDQNRLWGIDIGPWGGDELNLVEPGKNYGWPLATWGFDYSGRAMSDRQGGAGFEDPVLVWSPSIAPSGLVVYRGNAFPAWNGDLFLGSLSGMSVWRVRVSNGKVVQQERLLADLHERIRSVASGPDGYLYAITDAANGKLLRLRPGKPAPAELARVAKPFAMPDKLSIIEQLKLHGVMQQDATVADEQVPYDPVRAAELVTERCGACHSYRDIAHGEIGPRLDGLHGRRSGTLPGYAYSAALSNETTRVTWDHFTLVAFITNPQAYYPGTKMTAPPVPYEEAIQISKLLNDAKIGVDQL
ncbi:MAG: PQQ-dependent sugar dehydrogenase [Dehalococcoidia bacterium]